MRTPAVLIVVTSALFRHGLAAEVARLTMLPCGRYENALDFTISKILHGVDANDLVKKVYPELCDLRISSAVWNDINCGVNTLPGDDDRRITKSEDEPGHKKRIESSSDQPTEMADKQCTEHRKILETLIPLVKSVSSGRTIINKMAKQHHEYVCPIVNRVADRMKNGDYDVNEKMEHTGVWAWIETVDEVRTEFCGKKAPGNVEPKVRAPSPPSPSLSPCNQFKEAIDNILTKSLTGQNSPRDVVFKNVDKYGSLCDLQILSAVWGNQNCGVSTLARREDTTTKIKGVFTLFRTKSKDLKLIPPGPDDDPKCIDHQRLLTKMIPLALQGKSNEDILRPVAYRYHEYVCPIVRKVVSMQKLQNQWYGIKKLTNSASGMQRLFCNKVSPAIVGAKKKWKNRKQ